MLIMRYHHKSQSIPRTRAGFKVGMKLEGVDPLHPSMFCVLSVAEVIGCRLRLHIDGFSDCYDFWVNADSGEIKPAGWCKQTGRKLHPPKGIREEEFDWSTYLQSTDSAAAPPTLFTCSTEVCEFEKGMKVEAVDQMNPGLVCVASVSDVINNRLLLHFDNWDDTYDYWCDSTSPYIHPIGWCKAESRPLTAPQGHPEPFDWTDYLKQTGTKQAPPTAFTERAPHLFRVKHRLEAVDRRNPPLIRVATVTDTDHHRVKLHYDGWSSLLDVWMDSDHPDIHPVGWCQRTGHPLEPPPGSCLSPSQGVCPTAGCRGVGHVKGSRYSRHHSAFGCPYSDINLKKPVVLPDCLGGERTITLLPVSLHHHGNQDYSGAVHSGSEDESPSKRRRGTDRFLIVDIWLHPQLLSANQIASCETGGGGGACRRVLPVCLLEAAPQDPPWGPSDPPPQRPALGCHTGVRFCAFSSWL
ncbi:lethal(3)malignant brain tumor-like protein 4 isoform X2 [Gouania willdenowi]|uniref:lethal(3)malignant brain tumor-like protein 4 isoform X2 n=1 Tax=Gouania willdenowi TaxID=441366 RepID=UPI0010559211|nr:lethal(3)malignant brain tumor-like protein 4 isoform X2 [Gouania willdenowi]